MFKKILLSAGMISAVYGITPDAPPKENCPYLPPCYNNHPYLSVDFLYWVAKQEGNDFAATGVAITVPGTTDLNTQQIPPVITSQGKVYVPTPVGKPGFKVGAGLHLEYDEWDLFSEYSFLYSNATNSVYSNDLNAGILPIFSYTSNNSILSTTTSVVSLGARGFVTAATSKWTLQFNNINLELRKAIPLHCNFILRPHFGLEASWQTQHLNAQYFVGSITNPSNNLGNNLVVYNQYFWGIGPRLGLDGSWQCFEHLNLFANSGFATLLGPLKGTSQSYDTNYAAGYSGMLIADQLRNPTTLSPVMQLAIGVNTDWAYADCYHFSLNAAWEAQIWFFQNQHSSSVADINLVMQGLTLGAELTF